MPSTIESAIRVGHSRKAEGSFLTDPNILWGHQVAVMFQIISTLALSFADRAMAIAQLTQLHISILASGMPPGQVPAECFPGGVSARELTSPRSASLVYQ